jgi:hypothetical protein
MVCCPGSQTHGGAKHTGEWSRHDQAMDPGRFAQSAFRVRTALGSLRSVCRWSPCWNLEA